MNFCQEAHAATTHRYQGRTGRDGRIRRRKRDAGAARGDLSGVDRLRPAARCASVSFSSAYSPIAACTALVSMRGGSMSLLAKIHVKEYLQAALLRSERPPPARNLPAAFLDRAADPARAPIEKSARIPWPSIGACRSSQVEQDSCRAAEIQVFEFAPLQLAGGGERQLVHPFHQPRALQFRQCRYARIDALTRLRLLPPGSHDEQGDRGEALGVVEADRRQTFDAAGARAEQRLLDVQDTHPLPGNLQHVVVAPAILQASVGARPEQVPRGKTTVGKAVALGLRAPPVTERDRGMPQPQPSRRPGVAALAHTVFEPRRWPEQCAVVVAVEHQGDGFRGDIALSLI